MSEEAIAAAITSITVGQNFRIWYHDVSRYKNDSTGYEVDGMCIVLSEEASMLAGAPCDFTCSETENTGLTAKCNTQFYTDHACLFHAIEIL